MPIDILLFIIVLLPTALAWRRWLAVDQLSLAGTRKFFFIGGLVSITIALLEYLVFAVYTYHIGGFGTNFPAVFMWTRPGLWVSILALLLVLMGVSKSRLFGLISAVLMILMWIIPGWAM
jgi:hypothetical protein